MHIPRRFVVYRQRLEWGAMREARGIAAVSEAQQSIPVASDRGPGVPS
jgi:hypothetical protein